ncbi:MAG: TIGR04255 family protein [Chitinophagaceae bacterium]|nr:MAG: TIGR04255 family protein [Chitinophagaceae bacterium]
MAVKKLPNAPLHEVIFEAFWELDPSADGGKVLDSRFSFALGKFQEKIKEDFPEVVQLYPKDLPHQFLPYQTMYQFWKGKNQWPVLQIGPGIFAVNDTDKDYEWEKKYYPLVKTNLRKLSDAYQEINFISASLRYIDVVRVKDYGFTNWRDFILKHLNFSFENHFDSMGELVKLNFDQSFDLKEKGLLNLTISNGKNNKNEDILTWQTSVKVKNNMDEKALLHWLNSAHECTSDIFKRICKKDFYESFSK